MDPIKKINEIEAAVSKLKNLILTGEIKTGAILPSEKELATKLDLELAAVREATVVLRALGFIELQRDAGFIVVKNAEDTFASTTSWFAEHVEQMSDYMEARQAIESKSAALAVQRASEIEMAQLEQIHKEFEKANRLDDVAGLAEADKAFHNAIVKASHNKVLIIINHRMEGAFEKYRIKSFSMQSSRPRTLEQHRRIIDAIRARDAERAQKEMMHHLDIAYRDIYGITNTGQ